ncbi:hypothetical protein V8E53_005166 [Lactarius tabidus]
MGFQSPPCAGGIRENHRTRSKPCAETPKAETSPKNAPESPQESTRSVRVSAKTADKPLVPRTPWPKGVPAPSGRKGKSVSPSTTEKDISTPSTPEKIVSTPPAMSEVNVPAQPPRSPSSRRSSSCSTSQASPHTESPRCHSVEEYALESSKQPHSLLGNSDMSFGCSAISLVQERVEGNPEELLCTGTRLSVCASGLFPLVTRSPQQDIKCKDFIGEMAQRIGPGHPNVFVAPLRLLLTRAIQHTLLDVAVASAPS